MAAFCSCCGAEIKLKAEVCVACGTPRHGMVPKDTRPVPNSDRKQMRKPRL